MVDAGGRAKHPLDTPPPCIHYPASCKSCSLLHAPCFIILRDLVVNQKSQLPVLLLVLTLWFLKVFMRGRERLRHAVRSVLRNDCSRIFRCRPPRHAQSRGNRNGHILGLKRGWHTRSYRTCAFRHRVLLQKISHSRFHKLRNVPWWAPFVKEQVSVGHPSCESLGRTNSAGAIDMPFRRALFTQGWPAGFARGNTPQLQAD